MHAIQTSATITTERLILKFFFSIKKMQKDENIRIASQRRKRLIEIPLGREDVFNANKLLNEMKLKKFAFLSVCW